MVVPRQSRVFVDGAAEFAVLTQHLLHLFRAQSGDGFEQDGDDAGDRRGRHAGAVELDVRVVSHRTWLARNDHRRGGVLSGEDVRTRSDHIRFQLVPFVIVVVAEPWPVIRVIGDGVIAAIDRVLLVESRHCDAAVGGRR